MFVPGGAGHSVALDSGGAENSGAVAVCRRSTAGRWTAGNFVRVPKVDAHDNFGSLLALSADGGTLAVGAWLEDGPALPRPGSRRRDAPPRSGRPP